MTPVRGLRFLHARVLTEERKPAPYVVTRVARGVAYYRPIDASGKPNGSPQCCPVGDFGKWAIIGANA